MARHPWPKNGALQLFPGEDSWLSGATMKEVLEQITKTGSQSLTAPASAAKGTTRRALESCSPIPPATRPLENSQLSGSFGFLALGG